MCFGVFIKKKPSRCDVTAFVVGFNSCNKAHKLKQLSYQNTVKWEHLVFSFWFKIAIQRWPLFWRVFDQIDRVHRQFQYRHQIWKD